jgi:hypothetical protein
MVFDLCCCYGWCAYLEVLMRLQSVPEMLGDSATLVVKVIIILDASCADARQLLHVQQSV